MDLKNNHCPSQYVTSGFELKLINASRELNLRKAQSRNISSDPFKFPRSATTILSPINEMDELGSGVLILEIIDTGCGMTQEEKAKLFKPFSQVNKTVYSKFGGTGIGLWLSYKLITAMKGTLECNSKVNEGTRFIIKLPCQFKSSKIQVIYIIYLGVKSSSSVQRPCYYCFHEEHKEIYWFIYQVWLQNCIL